MQAWNWGNQATQAAASYAPPQAFPGQVAQSYLAGQVSQAYPAGQATQAYPTAQATQAYTAGQATQAYTAGQATQAYPTAQATQAYTAGQVQQTYPTGQVPQALAAAPTLVPGQQLVTNYQQFYAGTVPGTTSEVPAGYTQQQWEAAQQQHFIQWQQWNQQYQQWQQEYGNTYSMAVQGGLAAPIPSATAEPPPLPPPEKPPPPPEENRGEPPPNHSSPNFKGQKRPTEDNQMAKYQGPADKKHRGDNFQQYGRDGAANTWGSTTDAVVVHNDEEDRSEQERVFDSQFLSWEGEFLSWKEQNINHPDKNQYMEYEKKWTKWREELLQRREQMRKKRISSMAKGSPDAAATKGRSKADRAAFADSKAARNDFQDPSKQVAIFENVPVAPGHQSDGFGFRAGQPNQQPHMGQGQGQFPTNGKPEIKSLLDLPLQFTGQYAKKGYGSLEKDTGDSKPSDANSFVDPQKPQASQDTKSFPKTWAPNFQGPLQPKINFNFNKSGNNQQFDNANGSSEPTFGPLPKPDGPVGAMDQDPLKMGQPHAKQDFTQDVPVFPQKSEPKIDGDVIDITKDDDVAPNYDFLKKSSVIPGLDLTPEKSSDGPKTSPSNEKKNDPNANNQPQFQTSQGQGFEFAKSAGGQFGPNKGPPPQGLQLPPGLAVNPLLNQWPGQGDGQQGFGMMPGQGFQGFMPGFGPFGPMGQPGMGPGGQPQYFGPGSQNQNAGNSNGGPGNQHSNFGLGNQGMYMGQQNNPNLGPGNQNPNFASPGKGQNFAPGNQNQTMGPNYNNAGNQNQNMAPGNQNQGFGTGNMGPNYTNSPSNQAPNMGGNHGPNMGGNQVPNMGMNQGPNMGNNQGFGPGNMGQNFSPNMKPPNMIPPLLPPGFASGGPPPGMGITNPSSNFGGGNPGQNVSGPNFGPGNQKPNSGLGNQNSNFNTMDQMNRNNQGFGNQNFGPKDDRPPGFQRDQPPPRGPPDNQNFPPPSQFGSGPRNWGEGPDAREQDPQHKGPPPGLLGPNKWSENMDNSGPWNKGGGGRDSQHPVPLRDANQGSRDNFQLGDITKRPPLIDKLPGGPMNKFPPKDGFDGNKSGPMEGFPGSKEEFPKGFPQGPRDDFSGQDKFGSPRDTFPKDGPNFPPSREIFSKDGPGFPGPRESFPKDAEDRGLPGMRDRGPVGDPGFMGPRDGFPNEGPDLRGPRNRFEDDRPIDPLGPPREPFPGDRFPLDTRDDFPRDRFLARDRFGAGDGPRGGFPDREFDRDPFRDEFRSREAAFHGDRSRSMEFEDRGSAFFPRDHDMANRDYDAMGMGRGGWDPRGGGRPPHDFYRPRPFDDREGEGYAQWDRPPQRPPGWEDKVLEPVTIVEYSHKLPPTLPDAETALLENMQTFDYGHGATPRNARDMALLPNSEPWRRDKGFGQPEREGSGGKKSLQRSGRDRSKERDGDRFRGRTEDRGGRHGDRDNDRDRNGRSRDGKRDGDRRGMKSGPPPPAPPPPSFSSPSDSTKDTPKGPSQPSQRPILVEDLLSPPGRDSRPQRIVIILRGPPGSGKSFVTKLIKDKEVEMGGQPPRILCLDDYFMVEVEKEEKEPETGRKVKVKVMEYEYEAGMENDYRCSLVKAFKKTVNENYFPFIIVDCVNQQVKNFEEMWSYAKQKGFQVYICEMDMDVSSCIKRNTHNRTEKEIAAIVKGWEDSPKYYLRLDVRSLLQSVAITDVEMEDSTANDDEEKKEENGGDKEKTAVEGTDPDEDNTVCVSKWERMEPSGDKLDRLDGLRRRKAEDKPKTLEDWLQLSDDYDKRELKPGQKRVRWADLEEKREQEKMRAIGFVVGQTDWSRMTDPTRGESALTQTKYI